MCKEFVEGQIDYEVNGPPGRTRTCNLRLRRPLHYPVVLRAEGAQYPTPDQRGQVAKPAVSSLSGSTHNAGQHGADALIQKRFRFNGSIKQVNEPVGFKRCDAVSHRPDLCGEMQAVDL